jgi:hypothetical protein
MTGTSKVTLSGPKRKRKAIMAETRKETFSGSKRMRKKTMAGSRKETKKPSHVPQRKRKETLAESSKNNKRKKAGSSKGNPDSYWRMSNPGGNPGAVLRGCKSETPDRSGRMGGRGGWGGGVDWGGGGMVQPGGGGGIILHRESIGLIFSAATKRWILERLHHKAVHNITVCIPKQTT